MGDALSVLFGFLATAVVLLWATDRLEPVVDAILDRYLPTYRRHKARSDGEEEPSYWDGMTTSEQVAWDDRSRQLVYDAVEARLQDEANSQNSARTRNFHGMVEAVVIRCRPTR